MLALYSFSFLILNRTLCLFVSASIVFWTFSLIHLPMHRIIFKRRYLFTRPNHEIGTHFLLLCWYVSLPQVPRSRFVGHPTLQLVNTRMHLPVCLLICGSKPWNACPNHEIGTHFLLLCWITSLQHASKGLPSEFSVAQLVKRLMNLFSYCAISLLLNLAAASLSPQKFGGGSLLAPVNPLQWCRHLSSDFPLESRPLNLILEKIIFYKMLYST